MKEKKLILIFNHQITTLQADDARESLGVGSIVSLPESLQDAWGAVPPDAEKIDSYIDQFRNWIKHNAQKGDFVLIQGDFGATFLLVRYCLVNGLVPVYSTTERQAVEEVHPDGTVKTIHHFNHRRFRIYGG